MKKNYKNLSEFINALEAAGELARVRERVSPILEITEITNRVSKSPGGGKALLFENVEGSSMPVLTNAFGSDRRMAMALGVDDIEEVAERLKDILTLTPPETLGQKFSLMKEALSWTQFLPRRSNKSTPPCQEVVVKGRDVDLSTFPILQCWPKDAGRFVTLPLVYTKSTDGKKNVGMYRLQVFDRNTMGMHWHIHKDSADFYHEYEGQEKRMEVAVAIGTDPAVTYAATAPLPKGVNEMLFAGFLRKAPVLMTKCVTIDLEVPAEAEIIIEGYVDPKERRIEGPFGDHTGFYSPADMYPVFHVTAITHRRNCVYSATVVGRPPMEDCYLAKATERIFLPMLQMILPEVVDYSMPWEGVFHNLAIVSIDKRFPGQAQRVMHGLWGSGQMSFAKALVVFNKPVDFSKGREIAFRILDNVDLGRDILISQGIMDALDHAAPAPFYGGKIGIDLTTPLEGEGRRAPSHDERKVILTETTLALTLHNLDQAFNACRIMFPETAHPLLLASIDNNVNAEAISRQILASDHLPEKFVLVLFDSYADLNDESELLWRVCGNTDPIRDLFRKGNRLVVDARAKGGTGSRAWPDEIKMTVRVRDMVTEKAARLNIEGIDELPPSHYE
jgi:4-hydroxy-3-polyprenylbenzoate decarboxylase